MGKIVPIDLGQRSNPARSSVQAGSGKLINCFAEQAGPEGKSTWVIEASAGLTNFGSALSGGGIRALYAIDDSNLLALAGRNLYRVGSGGSSTLVGGIPTDGAAYMQGNRATPRQVGIVSDGYYAVYQEGSLTVVSDVDLPPPSSLAYLDGYGVLPVAGGRYFITSIDDFTAIDGLDVSTAESNPDEIIRAESLDREVVFFGTASIEWHQNTGDADFPLTRSQTAEIGCLAGDSVARVDTPQGKTLIWVAPDHTVRIMTGYSGQVISSNEVENLIRVLDEAGNAADLKATAWAQGGRFFYALSCTTWTRVFDAKTGAWHERISDQSTRWRVDTVTRFANKIIAGDRSTGQLYTMSDDTYDEAGNELVMEVITPLVHGFPYKASHYALHVDVATGVGLNSTGDELDPILMVDWSEDGGNTFVSPHEVALGRDGQDQTRVRINRLGSVGVKGRAYRFRISSGVKKLIMSASLDVELLEA